MLGYFVGRAPGVTLATVGVYSAVIGTANGLRKVNQAFNPIFAPVVAGMTANGRSRNRGRDLRAARSVDALDPIAARSSVVARRQHDTAHLWSSICKAAFGSHRRARECYQCVCHIGRNRNPWCNGAFEPSPFIDHMHSCRCRASVLDPAFGVMGAAFAFFCRISSGTSATPRRPAVANVAPRILPVKDPSGSARSVASLNEYGKRMPKRCTHYTERGIKNRSPAAGNCACDDKWRRFKCAVAP